MILVEPSALNELCDDLVDADADAVVTDVDNGLKVSEAVSHLKKRGNIKKRELHKHAPMALFAAGNQLLKNNVKKQRNIILRRKQRKCQLAIMDMKYHDTQLQHRSAALKAYMKENKEHLTSYVERSWEAE